MSTTQTLRNTTKSPLANAIANTRLPLLLAIIWKDSECTQLEVYWSGAGKQNGDFGHGEFACDRLT